MRKHLLIGAVLALAISVPVTAAVKDFHVTGFVTGDQGLITTLGGVDTNYVNLNNPYSGIRWQYAQILYGTDDPSVVGRDAPAPSLLMRTNGTTGELWFKSGPNPTDWQRIA